MKDYACREVEIAEGFGMFEDKRIHFCGRVCKSNVIGKRQSKDAFRGRIIVQVHSSQIKCKSIANYLRLLIRKNYRKWQLTIDLTALK